MTEYTAFVAVRRTADTVHAKIELNQHAQLEVNMLIAFEFLRAVLDRAEGGRSVGKAVQRKRQKHAGRLCECGYRRTRCDNE